MFPNSSNIDLDQLLTTSSVFQVVHVLVLFIPSIILCLLCVIALCLAHTLNATIRVALVNVFARELCYWVGISVFYFAYPLRVYVEDMDNVSCFVGHTFVRVGNMMVSPATTLYAIIVLVIIKHGKKKLKLYGVVTFIVISWMFATFLGLLPFFSGIRADPIHLFVVLPGNFSITFVSSVFSAAASCVCRVP